MSPCILVCIIALGFFGSTANGALCSNGVIETQATICPGTEVLVAANVSYRFQTVRDFAWVLTPRYYFLSNANKFTYRSIYEALYGRCVADETTLEDMMTSVEFALEDMKISMGNNGEKYIHLICKPWESVAQTLWNTITTVLKLIPVLDWETIETALTQLIETNPTLPTLIQSFVRFHCQPHPLCLYPSIVDTPYCSAGANRAYLENWEAVLSWTDHISDTDGTGTAFMLSSCINKKASWTVLSMVPQQSSESIDEFVQIPNNQSFNLANFGRQNYLAGGTSYMF
jgi:hypothetical protein